MRTLVQTVRFDAPPAELYELYADSKLHAAATGGEAKISRKVGGAFSAWDDYITGTNLALVKGRLIVQSWRADDWDKKYPDSTFSLAFHADGESGGLVDMVHAGVPEDAAEDLDDGWKDNYWTPWKRYLRSRAVSSSDAKTRRREAS